MPVENLSTGVIRRASLARALMHSPQILLIDEPAGGLDQETADAIQSLLAFVGREEGVTLFLCSSNMDFASFCAVALRFCGRGRFWPEEIWNSCGKAQGGVSGQLPPG